MSPWIGIVGTVITAAGVVIVAWLTRRTAKDQSAITGFDKLVNRLELANDRLQEQNDRQEKRIAKLEQDNAKRRRQDADRDRVIQVHQRWDFQVARRLRQLTDDPFPDPPPLEPSEAV